MKKSIYVHKLFKSGITHGPFYRFYEVKGKYLGQKYNITIDVKEINTNANQSTNTKQPGSDTLLFSSSLSNHNLQTHTSKSKTQTLTS